MIFILLRFLVLVLVQGSPTEVRLMNDLITGYIREERPVLDSSKPVVVTLGIALQQIINLNEKEEQLEVSAWLKFSWRDENLRWEPLQYEDIKDLRHPAGSIWQPDILLYNSVDPAFDSTFKVNLINYADGTINWVPPGIFKISCKLDIYWFPFDEQTCSFKFGSWSFSRDKIELQVGDFDFSEFLPNGEWLILSSIANVSQKTYECCPEVYEDIKFTLHLRRRTLYYAFNLIMPCMLVMILVILGFTLSPQAGEKIGLQISVSLAICLFLTFMNEITPQTSEAVPLLGVFFESCMVISVLATGFTVYVQSYHFRSDQSTNRMGFWLRYVLLEWGAWILRIKLPRRENTLATLAERWNKRNDEEERATFSFEVGGTNGTLFKSVGEALQDSFERSMAQIKMSKEKDKKTADRLRLLQKIYDHVKMIRDHDDDGQEERKIAFEWRFAAIVVDRLGLISFTLVLAATSVIIAVRAPYLVA